MNKMNMTDEEMITQMLVMIEKYVNSLSHNDTCHFCKKLAGIIIGMTLAGIDKATPNKAHAKEDMEKFKELVDDEATFYYHQEMNVARNV